MKANNAQKIILALFVFFIVYWLILAFTGTKIGIYNDLYSFLFSIIPFFGGVLTLQAAFRHRLRGTVSKGLAIIGLGMFCWACGGIIWSYYNFSQGILAPYPSLADFFYLPSAFLYSAGAIYLARAAGADFGLRQHKYRKLAIALLVALCIIIFYYVFLVSIKGTLLDNTHTLVEKVLDVAYPLGDLLSLVLSVTISGLYFRYLQGEYKISIFSILAGMAAMFIGDSYFSYITSVGRYNNAGISDLVLMIGMSLLAFGALGFCRMSLDDTPENQLHIFKFLLH